MILALQKFIYDLENGGSSRAFRWVFVTSLLLSLIYLFNVKGYHNLTSPEAMDAAQVARNVAAGNGFSTQVIRPLSLHLTEHSQNKVDGLLPASGEKYPDLATPPVYPLLIAGLMKLNGTAFYGSLRGGFYTSDLWLAVLNQVLLLIASLLLFRLAKRLFDSVVAWTSTFLWLGTLRLWHFSVSGLSTILLLVIFLGLIFLLLETEKRAQQASFSTGQAVFWAALAGLTLGLGALTRYSFGWLLIPSVAAIWAWGDRRHRNWSALACSLVFAAVLTPWLMRNYALSHTFFGVNGYAIKEGLQSSSVDLQRTMSPDLIHVTPRLLAGKLLTNLSQLVRDVLPRFGIVGAFFFVGILVPFQSAILNRLRWFTLGAGALLALAQMLGHTTLSDTNPIINSENLLVLFLPLVVIFGAGLFVNLLERFEQRPLRLAFIGCFCFIGSLPLVAFVFSKIAPTSAEMATRPEVIQTFSNTLAPNELCLSDVPWAVAWYGQRQCALLPLDTQKTLDQLEKRKHLSALYLSPLLLSQPGLITDHTAGSWNQLAVSAFVRHEFPPQFPLMPPLSKIPRGYLFLTDNTP